MQKEKGKTAMKVFNWIRNISFVFAVAIIIAALACLVLRIKPATVTSDSMSPTFHAGSVVFIKKNAAVKVGDPIAFMVGDRYVTHRIVDETETHYITKGDANNTIDPWQIDKKTGVDGKIIFWIPMLGYIFSAITSKPGLIISAALILCLILSMFFVSTEDGDEDEEKEGGPEPGNMQAGNEELAALTAQYDSLKQQHELLKTKDAHLITQYERLRTRHFEIMKYILLQNVIDQNFYELEEKAFPPLDRIADGGHSIQAGGNK